MYLQSAKSSNIIAHLSWKCCPRILPERLHRSVGRPNCSRAPAKCKMVQYVHGSDSLIPVETPNLIGHCRQTVPISSAKSSTLLH